MRKLFILIAACTIGFTGVQASSISGLNSSNLESSLIIKKHDGEKDLRKKGKALKKREKDLNQKQDLLRKEIKLNKKESKLNKKERKINKMEIDAQNNGD